MRSKYLRAGLASAALLSLACGIRFVAARTEPWPPPVIVVTPSAAHLASSVSVAALNTTLLTRLHAFNTQPLRGHLDIFGKDSAKAWDWTYLARSAVRIHRLNHDKRLIEAVLTGFAAYTADAARHEAIDGFGWYTENTRTGAVYREVSITGLVVAPIIDLLLEARTDPQVAEIVEPRRAALLDIIRRSLVGLDRLYIEEDGRGYYLLPAGGEIEPINLMSIYAAQLLGYWRLTSDAEPLREATGIARTWKAVLHSSADWGVSWPHTARPSSIRGPSNPSDFLYKAAAAIEFPLEAYKADLVLQRKDIEAIAKAPLTTLLRKIDDAHYQLRAVMDPSLDNWESYDPKAPSAALRPAAWYSYLCIDPTLAPALDAYLFGIDPKFYQRDGVSLLGETERLVIELDPLACSKDQSAAPAQALAGTPTGLPEMATGAGTTRSILR